MSLSHETTSALSDPWIDSNSPMPAAKLHAVGVVAYRWNKCELALLTLLAEITGFPRRDVWAMAHDLGDTSIQERIRTFMLFRGYQGKSKALVDNCIEYYDICRQNRNTIIHAWTQLAHDPDRTVLLARRSRTPLDPDPNPFPSELADLRRVADEIAILETRLWLLDILASGNPSEKAELLTSLETLPLPDTLWKPPLRVRAKRSRRPRSSPA